MSARRPAVRGLPGLPVTEVRSRFPALGLEDEGRRRIYLDNPAGTQVPRSVVEAVSDCFLTRNGNLGGFFTTSARAARVVDGAHRAMADLLGTQDPDEIVIGASMTTLTFHISRSICRRFEPGDEIVVSRMDHEANVAPWLVLAEERGLTIRWAPFDTASWRLEPETLAGLLTERTRLVALTYASNLTGSINDVKALTDLAKRAGALVHIDAVQLAPHGAIDVEEIGCDVLACSSYKFFGPHLGIVWAKRSLQEKLVAPKVRTVPDRPGVKFETGTPQIELLAGLEAAIDYIAGLGSSSGSRRERLATAFERIRAHENRLAARLLAGLEALPGITVYGITDPARLGHRVPTVSFRHASIPPDAIARALCERGIFVWSGHNYALELVRQLGIPEDEGVVRIGIAHYNTEDEIGEVLDALAEILA